MSSQRRLDAEEKVDLNSLKSRDRDVVVPVHLLERRRRRSSSVSSAAAAVVASRAGGARRKTALGVFAAFWLVWMCWTGRGREAYETPFEARQEAGGGRGEVGLTVEEGIVKLASPVEPTSAHHPPASSDVLGGVDLTGVEIQADSPVDDSFPSPGFLPFSPPASFGSPPTHLSHPTSLLGLSRLPPSSRWACLDAWVARGQLCPDLEGRFEPGKPDEVKLDVIWTWVNGTDERMRAVMEEAGREMKEEEEKAGRENAAGVLRHFREHDELRHSIRSVLSSLPPSSLSAFHLVAGDVPSSSSSSNFSGQHSNGPSRLMQVPRWLDTKKVCSPGDEMSASSSETPIFRLAPHSQLFSTFGVAVEQAEKRVPSFSSRAIEARTARVATAEATAVALNDDFFLLRPLSISDFVSPLTGPVFRMYRNFLVEGMPSHEAPDDREGEWVGLKNTNWLLSKRFGRRSRPYLAHVAKSLSMPVLREAATVFSDAFDSTAASRFRGRGRNEVTPHFLVSHYTIEKHREALLWSYLVARFDLDSDGFLSSSERRLLLSHLLANTTMDESPDSFYASTPLRTSLSSLSSSSSSAGLPSPKETTFDFLSSDGYAHFAGDDTYDETVPRWSSWPSFQAGSDNGQGFPCAFSVGRCLGAEFVDVDKDLETSTSELLKRVAFRYPDCGDCLVVHLVQKSGEAGLEAFLPPSRVGMEDEEPDDELDVEVVGLEGSTWDEVEYLPPAKSASARRRQALSLIQRYAYSIGSSPLAFLSVQSGGDALSAQLDGLTNNLASSAPKPAFLALNDDIRTTDREELREIDERLRRWMGKMWSTPSPWEKSEEE
ncbi:hypothetical protein JCM8097_001208 [Rhodosporidiobolus ruineniae]